MKLWHPHPLTHHLYTVYTAVHVYTYITRYLERFDVVFVNSKSFSFFCYHVKCWVSREAESHLEGGRGEGEGVREGE